MLQQILIRVILQKDINNPEKKYLFSKDFLYNFLILMKKRKWKIIRFIMDIIFQKLVKY